MHIALDSDWSEQFSTIRVRSRGVEASSELRDMQEEAKDAFKELLTSVNAASDWTGEHAMRLIISDTRYPHNLLLI